MTYKEAEKVLEKHGTSNATGDALTAMNADCIEYHYSLFAMASTAGKHRLAPKLYTWAQRFGYNLFEIYRALGKEAQAARKRGEVLAPEIHWIVWNAVLGNEPLPTTLTF